MRWLPRSIAALAALALLSLLPSLGRAQAAANWGQSLRQILSTSIVGGINPVDTSAVPLQFDSNGRLIVGDGDRDRDYSQLINLGISGVQLTAGKTAVPLTPRYIGQFSRGSILMSYTKAAVADSDSVVMAVYIYGSYSPAGTQHLWTPYVPSPNNVQPSDTCYDNSARNDTTAAVQHCLGTRPSYVVYRAQQATSWPCFLATFEAAGWRQLIRKLPAYSLRYGGKNGIMLGLTDNSGGVFPYPYITVLVQNLMTSSFAGNTIVGLEVNFWPRVN